MSSFLVLIDTDNAAFEGGHELSDILMSLSVKVDGIPPGQIGNGTLRDSNGNLVGVYNTDTEE